MEPTFDSSPTAAQQISDLFSHKASTHNSLEPIQKVNASIPDKSFLINPDEDSYSFILQHLRDKLATGNGETLFQIGVDGEFSFRIKFQLYTAPSSLNHIARHSSNLTSLVIIIECNDNGLTEDEMTESVATLSRAVADLNADYVLLRQKTIENGNGRLIGDYLIREKAKSNDFYEVRVAVVGNVDAGKSTLLGVLTHGNLDNGRGLARQNLFRHKHEIESGRTSSVGNDILGFDSKGMVVNSAEHAGHLDWVKICEASSKVITFIDLAGHERYLKTTIFGMTGHAPDYTMLMVGANAGIIGMTKEHLGLALALSVPVFVVITKVDMCPPNVLQNTLKLLQRVLKSPGCRKIPVLVQSKDDVVLAACNFATERLCPIFQVSNVTGFNLDLLKMFMNLLVPRSPNYDSEPAEFQIDDTYSVPVCTFQLS